MDEKDNFNQTPLFYAAKYNQLVLIKEFIGKININHKDNIGETALFYSIREKHYELTEYMLQNGANPNIYSMKKVTPLFFALRIDQQFADLLVKYGAIDKKNCKNDANKIGIIKESTTAKYLKKDEKRDSQPKLKYKLVHTDDNNLSKTLSEEDCNIFKQKYPDIYKKIIDPNMITNEDKINEESGWITRCQSAISSLWRCKNSGIFHRPVDPEKENVYNYFEIIKKPMDFGTIKKKLSLNLYKSKEDFISDVDQVFINCELYNGKVSYIGAIGVRIKESWDTIKKDLINSE